jgi:hypothetical protein
MRSPARGPAASPAVAVFALLTLLGAALLAPRTALAVLGPGESCPDTTPAPGTSVAVCEEGVDPGGGGATLDVVALLPILAAAIAGGAIALVAAFLVLRRRTAAPAAPADPGEWWTCRSCGKSNVIGSPRCYACGSWQS